MVQVVQVVQVVKVVRVVRVISSGDMHSGNIWFLWSKQSNYQEKLRCHARDIRMHGRTQEESGKYSSVLLDQKPQ